MVDIELLKQLADDTRAIRRMMERQSERHSFEAVLRGLKYRGVITQLDIERLEALEEAGTLNAQTASESPCNAGVLTDEC